MALWNNTTAPKWLLGQDNTLDVGKRGLGNNGIKNNKDISGADLEDGNELAMADDEKGVGWRIWHSKENGKNIGEGRGWWEILATFDSLTGDVVEMGGPVLGTLSIPSLVGEVVADVTIQLSAVDPDGSTVTFGATAGAGLGGIAVDATTGIVTITPAQLLSQPTSVGAANSTHVFTWTAAAGDITTTSADVTITVTAPTA